MAEEAEPPDYHWTVWYRDNDCRMPCLVRSMDTLESFREYEDAMGNIDHLWSLPMGSQIRIVKMSVDAHGRAEISNKWEDQKSRTQRGWSCRIRSWRPGPKQLSPKCMRVGGFGTRDTRKFIGSNVRNLLYLVIHDNVFQY